MLTKLSASILSLVVASCTHIATAEDFFTDDFSDGSVYNNVPLDRDGNAVVWLPHINTDQSAVTGDLMISGTNFAAAQHLSPGLADMSVRSQMRMLDGELIGLATRTTTASGSDGYFAFLNLLSDQIAISRAESLLSPLASAPNTLDPTQQDVMIQLDTFGNQISLWVWAADEAMPSEPTLSAVDDKYRGAGGISLWVATREGLEGGTSEATGLYRFVQVADQHIVPEPSSAVLTVFGCGGVWLTALRRKSRHFHCE